MKKMILAVAVLFTTLLTSCGNTEFCYQITTTVGSTSTVSYYWGTKNDLDSYKQSLKDTQTKLGMDPETITISSKITTKSKDDCNQ